MGPGPGLSWCPERKGLSFMEASSGFFGCGSSDVSLCPCAGLCLVLVWEPTAGLAGWTVMALVRGFELMVSCVSNCCLRPWSHLWTPDRVNFKFIVPHIVEECVEYPSPGKRLVSARSKASHILDLAEGPCPHLRNGLRCYAVPPQSNMGLCRIGPGAG